MSADDIFMPKIVVHPEKIKAAQRGMKAAVGISVGPLPNDDREVVGRVDGIPLRADDFAEQLATLMRDVAANDARVINALVERLAVTMVGYIKSPRFEARIKNHLDARVDGLIERNMAKNEGTLTAQVDERVRELWAEKVEQVAQDILASALREVRKKFGGGP